MGKPKAISVTVRETKNGYSYAVKTFIAGSGPARVVRRGNCGSYAKAWDRGTAFKNYLIREGF